jgi:small multidrug resistance pump
MNAATPAPRWMTHTLRAAGVYNVAFGIWAALWPDAFFRLSEMPVPSLPELWQCIGMIVGAYGVGYWIAARDPFTHWPIIFVGLLGKVLGPIGYVNSLLRGTFTWKAGIMNVTNDIIWWLPFTLILLGAWRHHRRA